MTNHSRCANEREKERKKEEKKEEEKEKEKEKKRERNDRNTDRSAVVSEFGLTEEQRETTWRRRKGEERGEIRGNDDKNSSRAKRRMDGYSREPLLLFRKAFHFHPRMGDISGAEGRSQKSGQKSGGKVTEKSSPVFPILRLIIARLDVDDFPKSCEGRTRGSE